MSLIKKPFQLKTQTTIKTLIYGQPGLGKTTFALSAPSPLLLDFDNGVHRVNSLHQSDTVQIEKWEDCINVLKEDLTAYKTLVIDTAGKMLDYMSIYLIQRNPKLGKANGALTLQGYGERKAEFNAFLKSVSLMGKNLVFVAHDKEEKEGDNKIIRPEIGGSSANDLIKELDLVGYMEAIGKKRTISFDPCEKFYGKNSCNLPSLIELPHLEDGKPNNALSNIFVSYQKSLETRKQTTSDYNDLIEMVDGKVAEIVDVDSANDAAEWTNSFDAHIWDSKLQAGIRIRDKAKQMGFVLGKNKKYELAKIAANEPAKA